jgi:flagellar motor switch protein FliG
MVDRRISESDREAMLRRVAIVLRALPPEVAGELLGSIGPQAKQAIHRTMSSLSDVDPLEQRRAYQAFKISLQTQPSRSPEPPGRDEDEITIRPSAAESNQPTSRVVSSPITEDRSGASNSSPLSFLSDVDDDTLIHLLAVEHPQAIALVLASIAAPHAARLLPRLDPQTQSDTLSRIGRLGNIPKTAVAEIAEHFKNRVAQRPDSQQRASGQRALHAILAELPSSANQPPQPPVADQQPAAPRTAAPRTATPRTATPRTATPPAPEPIAEDGFPSSSVPTIDLTHKLRVAEHTKPTAEQQSDRNTPETGGIPIDDPRNEQSNIDALAAQQLLGERPEQESQETVDERSVDLDSTDAIHAYLMQLPPLDLCHALGSVETRFAMLALCGLPNPVAEAVFEILPRAKTKQVRSRMNSLGSLQLREIDDAKEKVARASVALNSETSAHVPLAA